MIVPVRVPNKNPASRVIIGAFFGIYVAVTALSIPGAAVMTLAGGALFGFGYALLLVSFASTIGATLAFLVSRVLLRDWVQARFSRQLRAVNEGFEKDGAFYLFSLRLVPLFPFFVVNLVPAFLGVGLRTYVTATFIGIIPGAFVFASVGTGLGSVFDSMVTFSPAAALTPEVITALVGLSVLSLVPVAYKKLKRT